MKIVLLVLVAVLGCVAGGCANVPALQEKASIQKNQISEMWVKAGRGVSGLRDPRYRDKVRPDAVPLMREAGRTLEQLESAQKKEERFDTRYARLQYLSYLSALGDEEARQSLELAAAHPPAWILENEAAIPLAKLWLLDSEWLLAGWDKELQLQVVEEAALLAASYPQDTLLPGSLLSYTVGTWGPASPEALEEIEEIFARHLRSSVADAYAEQIAEYSGAKVQARDGARFFELKGEILDGASFSIDQWRGKVVLIDFWATWCGPCISALPYVEDAYEKYRAQGLEILGVSWDRDLDRLRSFVASRPRMGWPHLLDSSKDLGRAHGVKSIPTVLVIDRRGRLRSERMPTEKFLQELLAEQP